MYKDLSGRRFGKLTVLRREADPKYHRPYWRCVCDCGTETVVKGSSLVDGTTRSCGCLRSQPTHGDSVGGKRSRLYSIYHGMMNRCYCKSQQNYQVYGKRGIGVCDEWRNSYTEFKKWATMNSYTDNLSLDRIDNNKDYCPENCRWVSWDTQQNHRRYHLMITYNGKTQTAAQWSRELEIPYHTIVGRYHRGLSADEIFRR